MPPQTISEEEIKMIMAYYNRPIIFAMEENKQVYYNIRHILQEALENNSQDFLKRCSKYQNTYPMAYQRLEEKVINYQNQLSRQDKVEMIMQYIETNKIPTGRSPLRFCDIAPHRTNSRLLVGAWIQTELQKNDLQLLQDCSIYQKRYPNAYFKMELKIKRRHQYPIEEERLRIVMQYLEHNYTREWDDSLRFCDLDPTFGDDSKIICWFQNAIISNWIKDAIEPFQHIYPKTYQNLKERIHNLELSRQITKLSKAEKIEIFLRYINTNKVPNSKSKIIFSDIDPTTNDNINVFSWLRREFFTNIDEFLKLCQNHKEKYPLAVQKIEQKVQLLIAKRQEKHNYHLSTREKVQILMAHLENNDLSSISNPIRFCDLTPQVTDESKVEVWLNGRLSKQLKSFLDLILEYQNTYPVAYQKLCKKINKSKMCQRKERLLLIQELKRIRSLVQIEEIRVQNSLKKRKK